MTVYGLTGKTGSGKSTVAKMLSQKGFFVIDGDKAARQITEKGSPVLSALTDFFGSDIILADGTLNRKLLAERAFSKKENTEKLNQITHTAIDEIFKKQIAEAEKNGFEKCVIDAAALLESPSKRLCEKMIVVTAPLEVRLERILKRDEISKSQAMTRINAQKSDEYYLENADIIIRNYRPFKLEEEIEKVR